MFKRLALAVLALGLLLTTVGRPPVADEGRFPIWDRIVIAADGKYVVTRDLPPGPGPAITIGPGVQHVDIDLNGFTLFGDPGGGPVIEVIGFRRSFTLRNGEVRNQGPPGAGVFVEGTEKVVIEDVKVTDAQDVGIMLLQVASFSLKRNVILAANADGIAIDNSATGAPSHGTIEDNVIRDCGAGISVFIGESVAVINNRIDNTTAANGILLEDVTAALVASNTVQGALDAGIFMRAKTSKVYNNVILNSGADGIAVLGGTSNTLFLDNVSSGNGGDGIQVDGGQNHFDRNVLNSNGFSGLHFNVGAMGNTYGRNTMRGNAAVAGPCINAATLCGSPDYCDDNALPVGNDSFGDNIAPAGC